MPNPGDHPAAEPRNSAIWSNHAAALVTQLGVNFVQVNLTDGHFIRRVVEIIFEQLEVAFVNLPDQMH
jgi:hypothetical protein